MSQCEMVRIYSKQLYLPYIPSFSPISLFQVMFWFSNLTYFAHFTLNLAPLISYSFSSTFRTFPERLSIIYSFLPLLLFRYCSYLQPAVPLPPTSIGAPTVLSSSAIRLSHAYSMISCCFLVFGSLISLYILY